jgi:membrane protease YdiL (CAAX protease family)
MMAPWNIIAWTVFIVCFVGPFLTLINKKIKTQPRAMLVICSVVIVGIWLEHNLLLGPAFNQDARGIPLNLVDIFVGLGFLGLMTAGVTAYLREFPQFIRPAGPAEEVN